MNTEFTTIIETVVAERGKKVLFNVAACKSMLARYTRNEYKKECRLLLLAIEAGVSKAIDGTNELEICKQQQTKLLQDDFSIAADRAEYVVDMLAYVLAASKSKKAPIVPRPALSKIITKRNMLIAAALLIAIIAIMVMVMPKNNKVVPESVPESVPDIDSTTAEEPDVKVIQSVPAAPAIPAPVIPDVPVIPDAPVKPAPVSAFVSIKGGTFMMGSMPNVVDRHIDELPHQVTVEDFYMGKYEVTQAEYEAVMGMNPSKSIGTSSPVENVTWYDAIAYCNQKSISDGLSPAYEVKGTHVTWNKNANGYRLPTEAEWEYACSAGETTPFSTGDNITTDQANYDGNYPYNGNAKGIYRGVTTEVGSFSPNAWGLYDMHGNVLEWCWDHYGAYSAMEQFNPEGAATGDSRVFRGGSWLNIAQYLRSSFRNGNVPSRLGGDLGFRVVHP